MSSPHTVLLVLFGVVVAATATPEHHVIPEPRQSTCQFSYDFTSLGQQAYLQSPGWPYNYPTNGNCNYRLISPPGSTISLNCTEFNVEYTPDCAYDKFILSLSGSPSYSDGMTVCGQGTFFQKSTTNSLSIAFRSDPGNPASASLFRFQCVLTAIPGATTTVVIGPTAPPPIATTATTTRSPSSIPNCNCGARNEATRIVGGSQSLLNEFPWRAAMYSPNLGVFCAGTLIDNWWVLTAAHCTAALPRGAEIFADLGDHDLIQSTDATNRLIRCDRIIQHWAYNSTSYDNDMSLCHLSEPVTYSRTISPVCLPFALTGQSFQGKTVTASGWGTTTSGGVPSVTLQKVDLPVKTTEECRQYYEDSITDNMICTYAQGKDSCQGDSGGSIDYSDPLTGKNYAIGVVSWGVGCAGYNQPGVYAKVTSYLGWLESQTGATFCKG